MLIVAAKPGGERLRGCLEARGYAVRVWDGQQTLDQSLRGWSPDVVYVDLATAASDLRVALPEVRGSHGAVVIVGLPRSSRDEWAQALET